MNSNLNFLVLTIYGAQYVAAVLIFIFYFLSDWLQIMNQIHINTWDYTAAPIRYYMLLFH